MNSKLFCSGQASKWGALALLAAFLWAAPAAVAGDAPAWMHAAANAPLPPHDEKTEAVLLYSEESVSVLAPDKIRTVERTVYKILRPEGRDYGKVRVFFGHGEKIIGFRGWCIPSQGKDYEVKERDTAELGADGENLISDLRSKEMVIPAADPGNVIGYEVESEENPTLLQETWHFQEAAPAHERRYRLSLPPGWEFKATFRNYPEVHPVQTGSSWEWTVTDVKGIRMEQEMPPYRGVVGHMTVSLVPPGGHDYRSIGNWKDMGDWYRDLSAGRRDASPAIKSKVAELTASAPTTLAKMQAIADYLQKNVRYVSIQLGIGGFQPHPASDIFTNKYGDCKDKVTLASSMFHEIGVESYYLVINTERGSVTGTTAAYNGFNHMILAVRLPDGMEDDSLRAIMHHPKLGRLLIYDPTSELTPFGSIGGYLQANYGLLVAPDGGELVEVPQYKAEWSGVRRSGEFKLLADGSLEGKVEEFRVGDRAARGRAFLRNINRDTDRLKPFESILSDSLSNYSFHKASLVNASDVHQPLGYFYTFSTLNYAKRAGDLLMVRPRILGHKGSALLERPEPRVFPIEFEGPQEDRDRFEIEIPAGYVVDELPAPTDLERSFASYHSKTEVQGNKLIYTRTLTFKELSVPASRAAELKAFYRAINGDERNTAVLKSASR